MPSWPRGSAFTLIELLVVVTIIVVLLALLTPAMDKAIESADRAKCLANQRTIVQACHQYAMDYRRRLPPWKLGNMTSSAYDLRGTWNADVKIPLGIGLLPHHRYLLGSQLGKIIHCPLIDNRSLPKDALGNSLGGIGMDVKWQYDGVIEGGQGAGGSWWTDPSWVSERIIASYNYRSASWENAGKGGLDLGEAGSSVILSIDLPDLRFGGKFIHPDGYNRVFGDGHGSFFHDPERKVDELIRTWVSTAGAFAGIGTTQPQGEENVVYPYLATQK